MSISTYKVTKKSAHIQVFSLDMCRLNYGLSLYRDFFSALDAFTVAFFISLISKILFILSSQSRRRTIQSPNLQWCEFQN